MLSWFPGMPSGGGGYFHIFSTGYAASSLMTPSISIKDLKSIPIHKILH